ncbi:MULTISPECIES: DUF3558 domain-containing protein [unclassified Streptomyces]|uniref:DUF3558 domain-containing protein n=1 Tax=unclassified Streptomyces TaxID=2593676 RepID=UPI000375D7A8|nr:MULTISPECIES: DUF3558 domain-containing protein [unclassified Streptomyces]MYT29905.1 DUF3558 domain-containing protein [Streptomyces sp. SID8354]
MAQWDEDAQDWVAPSRPNRPSADGRTRRMLMVTVAVLVLVAGAVVGLWQLAGDDAPGPPDWSVPSALPSGSWTNTPTPGFSSEPGGGLTTTADPCTVIDASTESSWGLSAGSASSAQTGLKACSWSATASTTGAYLTYTLIYSKDLPMSPAPTPTYISGVPSASVAGNDLGCVVVWSASFGKVFVHARPNSGTQANVCTAAANFASLVAPRVPS